MADRGMIFSAPMVRALLAGRKSQHREVIKLPTEKGGLPIYVHPKMGGWAPTTIGGGGCFTFGRDGSKIPCPELVAIWHQTCGTCIATRYQRGDRLWARENWASWMFAPKLPLGIGGTLSRNEVVYEATDTEWQHLLSDREALRSIAARNEDGGTGNWVVRSSATMPRWASRLTLIVTDVRVQRLQDISEEDAIAEGILSAIGDNGAPGSGYKWEGVGYHGAAFDKHGGPTFHVGREDGRCSCHVGGVSPAQCAFRELWNSLHGPDAWAANPWICALSFRTIRANIDAMPAEAKEPVGAC